MVLMLVVVGVMLLLLLLFLPPSVVLLLFYSYCYHVFMLLEQKNADNTATVTATDPFIGSAGLKQ